MAENDNNDRPKSNGSQGTPEKSFSTNNVRSSNESFNDSKHRSNNSANSKTTQTPIKKGK